MRYKTITLSPFWDSCSGLYGEIWGSLDEALSELAADGWEIDHVINKTIVKQLNQQDLLFNNPILILKNFKINKDTDMEQHIVRQNSKIDSLTSIIESLDVDDSERLHRLEAALTKNIKVLKENEASF